MQTDRVAAEALPPDAPGRSNLRRLAQLRLAILLVLVAGTWAAHAGFQVDFGMPLLAGTGLAVALLSLLTLWRCRQPWPIRDYELGLQLALDLLALTAVFQASSGAANPFVSLYLVPLVVAAATLPRLQVWLLSLLACAGYTWLLLDYGPLQVHHHPGASGAFDLHVVGMWGNFMLSAGIIGIAVVNMGAALREREARLSRAREDLLRTEQILGLATLAAGAAHELGTPLSTIAVLSRELEHECADRADLQEDLRTLRSQVGLCKDIIQRMLARNPLEDLREQAPIAVADFLEQVVETWRLMRPGVVLDYEGRIGSELRMISGDQSLAQALINLLNNAADASPDGIEVQADSRAGRVVLEILDHGPGIDPGHAHQLGRAWFSTKAEGHGLGLFLSNATLERLGGSVRVENRSAGGALTTVEWPLT